MTFTIPEAKSFNCIKPSMKPPASKYAQGFFMYRWTTKTEATSQEVNSDDLGDINPYYLLTELMTNLGTNPLASKGGGCLIPKCGTDPAGGGCVLERIYMEMNHQPILEVMENAGIWGQYMSIDNGIPSQYSYWAFNWTNSRTACTEDTFSQNCNFYFKGGYPIGCQAKSDVMDTPIWYSTVAACPQYPFDPTSHSPAKVNRTFQWHGKFDMNDPVVKQCYKEMPGGNYCGGKNKTTGKTLGHPWTTPSKTCTWQAQNAGYLTVEDILNIPNGETYHDWCVKQPDEITGFGHGTGIPENMTLFYNLSMEAFPVLKDVTTVMWHNAASADQNQLTKEQKAVFQNWAKWSKVRLAEMFNEMDKQAFKHFNKTGVKDPSGEEYEGCLSNKDVSTPACNEGMSASQTVTV